MNAKTRLAVATVGALIAGVVNGLLGAGGGIILIFVLASSLGKLYEGESEFYKRRDLMATSLCVMMPVSAFSAIRYGVANMLDFTLIARLILPAVLGGAVGGILLDRLRENLIMKLFALLVIYSGLAMIVR